MIANFIDVSPAMRYMRSLTVDVARRATGWQKGECTWCGQKSGDKRLWCGPDCVRAFLTRCRPADAKAAFVEANAVATIVKFYDWSGKFMKIGPPFMSAVVECAVCQHRGTQEQFQLDHILPVSDGGGLCGPENYRLLCLDCHKRVSAEGAKRRAALRKARRATV